MGVLRIAGDLAVQRQLRSADSAAGKPSNSELRMQEDEIGAADRKGKPRMTHPWIQAELQVLPAIEIVNHRIQFGR